jgi:hypothetical protein
MKTFLIICIFGTFAYSACAISCVANLQVESQTTQSELSSYFQQVMQALGQLDNAYADYQDIINEQNALLKDLQQLNKENAIEEKQRAFLLNKAKQTLGTSVDTINSQ